MRRLAGATIVSFGCAFVWMGAAHAQFGRGGGWATSGSDAQRSFWVRADPKISKDSMQKPGFQFLWKIKLPSDPKQSNSMAPPVLLEGYIGYRGFRSLGYVTSGPDNIVGIDTDLGRIEWQKRAAAQPGCASNASLTRPAAAAFPGAPVGRSGGGGRGGAAAKSAVGKPGEGAVTIQEVAANAARGGGGFPVAPPAGRGTPGAPGAPVAAGRGGRGGPDGGRGRTPNYLHVLASDGMLHNMYVSNGDEPEPPVKFLPPNANVQGFILVDNVAYAATTPGCGGAPDGVWALDLASKEVASWKPATGGIAGSAGPAIGPDGTLYVATAGGDLVALEPKTLKVKDSYRAGQGFTSSPVIFEYKERTLIAATTKDGRIHLLDAKDFGGAGHQTPLYQTPPATIAANSSPGALASWQDAAATRWVLASSGGTVGSWKLVEQNGALTLQAGWTSREIASPLPPTIVNGVVFAASGGSSNAVVYALDGTTGKELWNSGKSITSSMRGGGLSAGSSQVYLGTYDGTFYAFGFPIEH
jgi:outer membrane protein assembly factor BamB